MNVTRVLRPKDVAARWLVSERHVRSLIANGKLASFRVGDKLIRLHADAIEEYERRCQNINSPDTEAGSLSSGATKAAVIDIRSARTAARKPTNSLLAS